MAFRVSSEPLGLVPLGQLGHPVQPDPPAFREVEESLAIQAILEIQEVPEEQVDCLQYYNYSTKMKNVKIRGCMTDCQ